MLAPRLHRWTDPETLSNLLIFAQALSELLFDHTIDSYKATALNVHSNVRELHFLAIRLVEDRINSGALIPVIEELEDKMKSDPVLSSSSGSKIFRVYGERIKRARHNGRASDLLALTKALNVEMDENYWIHIKELLLKAVRTPKNNREILALANVFVSEAEVQGYSRSFLYHAAQRFFFKYGCEPKEINSVEQIEDFLALFDSKISGKYKAVFRGSKSCLGMSSLAENFPIQISEVRPSEIPSSFKINNFLGESEAFPVYLSVNLAKLDRLELKDPNSARDFAEIYINILSDIYCFHEHSEDPKWTKTCLILDEEENRAHILNPAVSPMKKGTEDSILGQSNMFDTAEMVLGNHLEGRSRPVFLKALKYHRAALEADTAENQLIDLWAALEGFLPPPRKDDNRISHYVGTLLASLNLSYSGKIFRYTAQSMLRAGSDVCHIVDEIPIDGDSFAKATCLIVSNELEENRNDLYAALSRHPLLRFRCFTLHENFSSSKRTLQSIDAHRERVSWHIQRIYTTRNQIVHSAESLPYISTLVENLHSYLDTLIETIMVVALNSDIPVSLEGALQLLAVQEQNYFRDLLEREEECNCDNFKEIIFGQQNSVSPFHDGLSL